MFGAELAISRLTVSMIATFFLSVGTTFCAAQEQSALDTVCDRARQAEDLTTLDALAEDYRVLARKLLENDSGAEQQVAEAKAALNVFKDNLNLRFWKLRHSLRTQKERANAAWTDAENHYRAIADRAQKSELPQKEADLAWMSYERARDVYLSLEKRYSEVQKLDPHNDEMSADEMEAYFLGLAEYFNQSTQLLRLLADLKQALDIREATQRTARELGDAAGPALTPDCIKQARLRLEDAERMAPTAGKPFHLSVPVRFNVTCPRLMANFLGYETSGGDEFYIEKVLTITVLRQETGYIEASLPDKNLTLLAGHSDEAGNFEGGVNDDQGSIEASGTVNPLPDNENALVGKGLGTFTAMDMTCSFVWAIAG